MPNKINDNICPLCEKTNRCGVKSPEGCWCMTTQVPAALLEKVSAQLKGKTCICNDCIERYQQQQAELLSTNV
jgi:hypothetical protein